MATYWAAFGRGSFFSSSDRRLLRRVHAAFSRGLLWVLATWLTVHAPLAQAQNPYAARLPVPVSYWVAATSPLRLMSVASSQREPLPSGTAWIDARLGGPEGRPVQVGRQLVLKCAADTAAGGLLATRPLRIARVLPGGTLILEAADAATALTQCAELQALPGVEVCYPLSRQLAARHGAYARKPNDSYFPRQWHLENRETSTGQRKGIDLNVRAAWPLADGRGVTIGIVDDGVEYTHPDLAPNAAADLHFNFVTSDGNGLPMDSFQDHGTAVAGLAAAAGGNRRGVSGVAPAAHLASMVVFGPNDALVDDARLMDAFQYRSNVVAVQNHSWGNASLQQLRPEFLTLDAISNAYAFGRNGLGTVFCRSAGNGREDGNNVNDDGYASDPRAIAVAAARSDGQVASYSTPGAAILVAGPSGDAEQGFSNIFTTDRQGTLGLNREFTRDDLSDYAFEANGFTGTSASSPQIAGLCALLLSANPRLHVRDVQMLLALNSRQTDPGDPDLVFNGAGQRVSHNLGFGVPDAGAAVRAALTWPSRGPLSEVSYEVTNRIEIPDSGLRLALSGDGVPANLRSIPAGPMVGLHPDDPTPVLPLEFAGSATNAITQNLTNRGALVRRGVNFFADKIEFARQAGAAFVVVFNNDSTNRTERILMGGTERTRIPAVFINYNDGEQLQDFLATGGRVDAQLRTESARAAFTVPDRLICEHVGVRIRTDHQRRADLRVALRSPSGVWSVLQTRNFDRNSDLLDWTYYSTRHFLESSHGEWVVHVTDEADSSRGALLEVKLILRGTAIQDTDADGLDDGWEQTRLKRLDLGPLDDPDADGSNNAREQAMGSDPLRTEATLAVDAVLWDHRLIRLSWAARADRSYEVLAADDPASAPVTLGRVTGTFPEAEWFGPVTGSNRRFFQIREIIP